MKTSISKRVEVDVDVDFEPEDLEDDDLLACVKEAVRRGLAPEGVDPERLKDVLGILMRPMMRGQALAAFEAAYFGPDGSDLLEAYRAMQAGQWSQAICLLDKVIYETDARGATALPKRKEAA